LNVVNETLLAVERQPGGVSENELENSEEIMTTAIPINYTLVSPSKVGVYAACTQRLVLDSDAPRGFSSNKWADFGTVCHYMTQFKLGCAPEDEPTQAQMDSARELVSGAEEAFINRVDDCAELAISALPPLKNGVTWLSEYHANDPKLLPMRRSRKNPDKIEGYGGSIDLMASDRSIIVDLKFVSKQPFGLKIEYLWQLASYAMLTGVRYTFILWTMTTGKTFYKATIDWKDPKFAPYMTYVRKFVERTGQKSFRDYAYAVKGDHCDYCEHKEGCGAYNAPTPVIGLDCHSQQNDMSWLDKLQARASQEVSSTAPQPALF
jgi:hypothetical protein